MRAWQLKRGDTFALVPDATTGLMFETWGTGGGAVVQGVPDLSGYGRAFESGVTRLDTVYPLNTSDTKEK